MRLSGVRLPLYSALVRSLPVESVLPTLYRILSATLLIFTAAFLQRAFPTLLRRGSPRRTGAPPPPLAGMTRTTGRPLAAARKLAVLALPVSNRMRLGIRT